MGRGDKYPWDQWLDGSIWKLTHGEDFDSKPESMRTLARAQADTRGMKLKTRIDGNTIVIQAVPS